MSVLRRGVAEFRSMGGWVTGQREPGVGHTGGVEPGSGRWADGMRWESWGTPTYGGSTGEAMRISAVFGCWRLLSDSIGTLPIDVYRRVDGARIEVTPPVWLQFLPPRMSRTTYIVQVILSLLADGNAFVAIQTDNLGDPEFLTPLDPGKVTVRRNPRTGLEEYVVDGRVYDHNTILHLRGMTLPGELRGVSPLRAARDIIESGRRAQDFGSAFMANAAVPPAVIEVPDTGLIGVEAQQKAQAIAKTWHATNGGASNAGKVGVLLGGATLKTIAVSPEDAQWLDAKRFTVSEIARFYGVPPHLLADASNSTSWGSGLAEQNMAFAQFSQRPWIERFNEAHTRLLYMSGRLDEHVKLNNDAFLSASLLDRYAAYSSGIEAGHLKINEARRLEDLPPVPWGDKPPTQSGSGGTMTSMDLATALQKIYLSVGAVITTDEAREILNRDGAGLTGPAPTGAKP